MNSPVAQLLAEQRMEQAADWFVRLREAPTNTELVTAWLKWCEEHPDNQRAFSEVEEIWTLSGEAGRAAAATPAALRADRYAGDVSVSKWLASMDTQPPQTTHARTHRHTQTRARWAYATGLVAMSVLATVIWRAGYFGSNQTTATEYATTQAVEREVRLADGSVLTLGGASTVRVAYSAQRRDLELLRGEAYFKVQHDTSRPFVVRTQHIAVIAVGTAFNVRADGTRTVVSVNEGVVEVTADTAQSNRNFKPSSLRASAGQQVSLDMIGDTLAVQLSDTRNATEWREGVLSFVDEPLRTVVARVNRYAQHEIVLDDAVLGDLRFTGTVFRERIGDWANGLERVFPLQADTDAQGAITLTSAAIAR